MTQAFNLSQLANNVNTAGKLDASAGLVNATPVANGGTGATTLTANNVLLGNGTSAVQTVAPGTTNNILQSNGTTWVSQPISGVVTSLNGVAGAVVTTDALAIGSSAILAMSNTTNLTPGGTISGTYLYFSTNSVAGTGLITSLVISGDRRNATSSFTSGYTYNNAGTSTWRYLGPTPLAGASYDGVDTTFYVGFFMRVS